jgi:2-iminobutanoate/2-iminopropanoate deaminase
VALTGVTLWDGTGVPHRSGMTIVVRDERIAAIFPDGTQPLPSGASIRALAGRFIIPGLIDSHSHVAAQPSDEDRRERVTLRLFRALRGGRLEGETRLAPGAGPPRHVHFLQDEGFTVVQGRIATERLGEAPVYAEAGESVVFPADVPHKFWNAGDTELHCSAWVEPPGNVVYLLQQLFASQQRNGGARPSLLDIAFLMKRYRGEFAMVEIPAVAQRLLFPVLVAIGTVIGAYASMRTPRRRLVPPRDRPPPLLSFPPREARSATMTVRALLALGVLSAGVVAGCAQPSADAAASAETPAAAEAPEYFQLRPEVEKAYGYTHAVRIGDDVKISGAVSMDSAGNPTAVGDLEQQMKNAYEDLRKVLAHYGMTFDDVIVENVFTTDMAKFLSVAGYRNTLYTKQFPTGTWLEVKGLALPQFMIEIELEARRTR